MQSECAYAEQNQCGVCKFLIVNKFCYFQQYNLIFLICIAGPVASDGANVSTGGVAIQGKFRSQL